MSQKDGYVYILTNKHHTVLYTGVTSDLLNRLIQHKTKRIKGFTQKYNVDKLVYFEGPHEMIHAIEREKQIKAGSRIKKLMLIESINPDWNDLYSELIPENWKKI